MTANVYSSYIGTSVLYQQAPGVHTNMGLLSNAPCAATIIHMDDERGVNLDVTDHRGTHHALENVALIAPGQPVPEEGSFAFWRGTPPVTTGAPAKKAAAKKTASKKR